MRGVLEVDLNCLAENIKKIKKIFPDGCRYIAVVKADAYGLGLKKIAAFLGAGHAPLVDGFAVANVAEAKKIRSSGVLLPVLILSPMLSSEVPELVSYNAIPLISSQGEANLLQEYCEQRGIRKSVHIKIDTGMGRSGVWYDDAEIFLEYINKNCKNLEVSGLATHYSSITTDPAFTLLQQKRFVSIVGKISRRDLLIHASSSFGIEDFAGGTNAVRIGALQYGMPSSVDDPLLNKLELRPVTCLKAYIGLIKNVPAGTKIGYDRTFRLTRDTKIALISIGYADGISVQLSNLGAVLVRGHRCSIIGRVSMDQIMIDVTDLKCVAVEDEVIFWGQQGDAQISLHEFSEKSQLPIRACTCGLSDRIGRVYVE